MLQQQQQVDSMLPAIVGAVATAMLGIFLYALVSKSREEAEKVLKEFLTTRFDQQLTAALAKWEKDFRERLRQENAFSVELSARDFLRLSKEMESQLNGRYWLAKEAREEMGKLHDRLTRFRDEVLIMIGKR